MWQHWAQGQDTLYAFKTKPMFPATVDRKQKNSHDRNEMKTAESQPWATVKLKRLKFKRQYEITSMPK